MTIISLFGIAGGGLPRFGQQFTVQIEIIMNGRPEPVTRRGSGEPLSKKGIFDNYTCKNAVIRSVNKGERMKENKHKNQVTGQIIAPQNNYDR
jgi:hypothetical protein